MKQFSSSSSSSSSSNTSSWSSWLWLLALSRASAFDIPQSQSSPSKIPRNYAAEAIASRPDVVQQQQPQLSWTPSRTRRRNSNDNMSSDDDSGRDSPEMVLQSQRENNHHRFLQSSRQYQPTSLPQMEVTAGNKQRSSSSSPKSLFWERQHPKKQRLLAKLLKQQEQARQEQGQTDTPKRQNNTAAKTNKKNLRINNMMQRASHQHARVRLTTSAHWNPSMLHDHNNASDNEESTPACKLSTKKSTSSSALLTKDEEMEYASQLKVMREAIRTRDELVKEQDGMYIHPTEEEWAFACRHVGVSNVYELRRIMIQGQEARSILCEANVGLVTSIAKRHYKTLKHTSDAGNGSVGTILTLHDMIQEGNLGLMEAAERFEPQRGFRFSTYATWWIRQRILRSISDSSRVIRLPAHVHGMLHKIRRARVEIQAREGKPASLEQLAQRLNVPLEKVQKYTESSRNVVSLEVPLQPSKPSEPNLRTLGDTLASDAPTPVEDAEAEYLKRDIRHVIHTELAEKERDVILRRFGFIEKTLQEGAKTNACDDDEGAEVKGGTMKKTKKTPSRGGSCFTVAQTAEALGLSADRVRLIEARALNKLRSPQRNYRLREYVNQGGTSGAGTSPSTSYLHSLNKNKKRKASLTASSSTTTGLVKDDCGLDEASSDSMDNFPMMSSHGSHNKAKANGKNRRSTNIHKRSGEGDRYAQEQESSDHESNGNGPRPDRMWFF